MTAPAWSSTQNTSAADEIDDEDDDTSVELTAGERIGEPVADKGGGRVVRASLLIFTGLGAGWMLFDDTATWPKWAAFETGSIKPWAASPPVATTPPTAPDLVKPLPSSEIAATPGSDATATATPPAPAAPDVETNPDTADTAPLRSAIPDPKDPTQVRAAAVGIHPDVSRALLTRLSPTDYKNAAAAIKTALSQTPDSDVLDWPRDAKPDAAVFQVRFVRGAVGDCRRYVVTITKDQWVTTAPAMEKCGIPPIPART